MHRMFKLLQLLRFTPVTVDAAAIHLKIHRATAHKWLKGLHAAGVVFVAGWVQDSLGRDRTPVYAFGVAEDLPKRAYTRREISRRYRERKQGAARGEHSAATE